MDHSSNGITLDFQLSTQYGSPFIQSRLRCRSFGYPSRRYSEVINSGLILSRCSSVIEYPNQRISDGTLVFNATEVTPADAIVYLRACESDQGPVITIDGSDPSSWLVTLPGQCALIWVNDTSTSVGCKKTAVIVEASQVSEHCDEDPWAEICNSLPDPAPSSAVPLTLARAAVVTVAVLVTNAAFYDMPLNAAQYMYGPKPPHNKISYNRTVNVGPLLWRFRRFDLEIVK